MFGHGKVESMQCPCVCNGTRFYQTSMVVCVCSGCSSPEVDTSHCVVTAEVNQSETPTIGSHEIRPPRN